MFTIQATKELTNITIALASIPIPKIRINIGVQARPGTGRIRSNTGRTSQSHHLFQAMAIPRGTPKSAPMLYPIRQTFRLSRRCCPRVAPSGFFSTSFVRNVSTVFSSPGKTELLASFITSMAIYQTRSTTATEAQEIKIYLYCSISFFI